MLFSHEHMRRRGETGTTEPGTRAQPKKELSKMVEVLTDSALPTEESTAYEGGMPTRAKATVGKKAGGKRTGGKKAGAKKAGAKKAGAKKAGAKKAGAKKAGGKKVTARKR